jgi:hypothetical protein
MITSFFGVANRTTERARNVVKGRRNAAHGDIMLRTIRAVCLATLVILAAGADAANSTLFHPEPWPIRHWRNHQPRRSDLKLQQIWKIDRLYLKIEREDPKLIAPDFQPK